MRERERERVGEIKILFKILRINMRKEISFGKGETKVKWREDSKGYMKVELRPRRRERESGVTANGKSFQRDSSDRHGRGRRGNIPSNGGHCNPLFPNMYFFRGLLSCHHLFNFWDSNSILSSSVISVYTNSIIPILFHSLSSQHHHFLFSFPVRDFVFLLLLLLSF